MIQAKLLKFQQQGISLEKDGANPHFHSQYVTLNEVLRKVKKPLNDLGILIVQEPTVDGLMTRLVDTEDGSEVTGSLGFVGTADMQKLGGALTYARRYTLISLLGLEDDDKDGEDTVSRAKGVGDMATNPFND